MPEGSGYPLRPKLQNLFTELGGLSQIDTSKNGHQSELGLLGEVRLALKYFLIQLESYFLTMTLHLQLDVFNNWYKSRAQN